MPSRAVFLDRDGVINEAPPSHEYVTSPDELVVVPSAAQGLRLLRELGFLLIVVSNQRGVARGVMGHADVEAINSELQTRLSSVGAGLDAFYYCPHSEEEGCECRKPKPGLLLGAARERGISLSHSYLVGDAESDVEAGKAAGCKATIRVGRSDGRFKTAAHYRCADLCEAAALIAALEREADA